jgi:GNAT superfamily N-acetyltransferase
LIGLGCLALIVLPLLSGCVHHLRVTGEVVPLLGVAGFLLVASSVSAMDAISGVFLGLGFLGTKTAAARVAEREEVALRVRLLPLTRHRTIRYLNRLINVDATTIGERWGRRQWLLDLPQKWELSWLLLAGHSPLGFLIASRKESVMHIHRLATAPTDRNRGFGTRLLGVAARHGRAKGCLLITLKVAEGNEGAIRFYQRLGFHISNSSGGNLTMSAPCQDVVERAGVNRNNRLPGFSGRISK